MRCVSPKKGLDSKGRLKPGHRWLPGGKPCIVPTGKASSSGGSCRFGRVKRGKNKGKCRTAKLPDFSKFRQTKGKVSASVRRAMQESMQRGRYPVVQSDMSPAQRYNQGAAAFAARMRSGRRPRDARGRFI